jgi:hypothetical protein
MSLLLLTAYVVICEVAALGVFFSALVAFAVTQDGTLTIDLTRFGEMWAEYWFLVAVTAVTPYALYMVDKQSRQ